MASAAHVSPGHNCPMEETLIERIDARLKVLGISRAAASEQAGLNVHAIRSIAEGRSKSPRYETLSKLARVLQTSPEWLANGDGEESREFGDQWHETMMWMLRAIADTKSDKTDRDELLHACIDELYEKSNMSEDAIDKLRDAAFAEFGLQGTGTHASDLASEPSGSLLDRSNVDLQTIRTDGLVGDRDFPIYTSAQGGATGMVVSYEPIEWVRRPEPLFNVKGGFGMYVVGDSMDPVFVQGDTLLVHPVKPPQRGDDVLVVLRDGDDASHAAMVKRLVGYDRDKVRLRQFNPPEEFDVEREKIQSMQLIVGSYKRR